MNLIGIIVSQIVTLPWLTRYGTIRIIIRSW